MRREEIEALARMFGRTYETRSLYRAATRRALERTGVAIYAAEYDANGDCLTCGEAGRCGGWHLLLPETTAPRHEETCF